MTSDDLRAGAAGLHDRQLEEFLVRPEPRPPAGIRGLATPERTWPRRSGH